MPAMGSGNKDLMSGGSVTADNRAVNMLGSGHPQRVRIRTPSTC